MPSRCTLVLDAGTSRARCFVFDSEGGEVASRSRAWEFVESGEAYSLSREWEPSPLWRMISDLMGECVEASGVSVKDIEAVAVTSQRQAVVFLDAEGDCLYAGPNLDLRAFFEGAEIDETYRERVYRTTGHLPSFLFAPAKLRWLERHRPEAFARARKALTLADWLIYRLTGEIASERTLACEAGLLDVGSREYCDSLLRELGIEVESGRLIDAGCVVGRVNADAAERTMLSEGTVVVAAGADTQCGLLGMGVRGVGEAGIVAGWSVPVQMISGAPLFSDDASTWAGCYPAPDKWVIESSAGDAGNAYSWLVSLLTGDAEGGYKAMAVAAGEVPAGSEGAQAILGNARTQFSNPGMRAGGFVFPVPLALSVMGMGNFARAALESVSYCIKANLEHLEATSGQSASLVALGGGMTRTRTLGTMMADVLGRDVRLSHTPDASATGAWLCAGIASGEFSTLDEAARWARERAKVIEPNPRQSAEYQHFYAGWLDLADRLDRINL